jgi:next to BRCA1 gene 1 protein
VAQLKPGEVFVKTWRLMNNGNVAWPVGTSFKIISGTNFKANHSHLVVLRNVVAPGESYNWEVQMSAP